MKVDNQEQLENEARTGSKEDKDPRVHPERGVSRVHQDPPGRRDNRVNADHQVCT